MSFAEVLNELPALTLSERQLLIRRALELDEAAPSSQDLALVETRLAAHRQNPGSSLSLDEMKTRTRSHLT